MRFSSIHNIFFLTLSYSVLSRSVILTQNQLFIFTIFCFHDKRKSTLEHWNGLPPMNTCLWTRSIVQKAFSHSGDARSHFHSLSVVFFWGRLFFHCVHRSWILVFFPRILRWIFHMFARIMRLNVCDEKTNILSYFPSHRSAVVSGFTNRFVVFFSYLEKQKKIKFRATIRK